MSDEEYYLIATKEVDGENKDVALWAKSIALAEGDENKARFKYINLKVTQLLQTPPSRENKENQAELAEITPSSNEPTDTLSLHYIPASEFAEYKGIPVDKIVEMVRGGFYIGIQKDGNWYIHRNEVDGDFTPLLGSNKLTLTEDNYIPASEFAEYKGIPVDKIVEMVRGGFYNGRLIKDEWFVSYSEVSRNHEHSTGASFFGKLTGGHFGLPMTYWGYGFLGGLLFCIPFTLVLAIGSIELSILLLMAYLIYQYMIVVGIWKASDLYQGPKVWAYLAKFAVIIGCLSLIASMASMVIMAKEYEYF